MQYKSQGVSFTCFGDHAGDKLNVFSKLILSQPQPLLTLTCSVGELGADVSEMKPTTSEQYRLSAQTTIYVRIE